MNASIEQNGVRNSAYALQSGYKLDADITQKGTNNKATTTVPTSARPVWA